jgi:hypothetical protein
MSIGWRGLVEVDAKGGNEAACDAAAVPGTEEVDEGALAAVPVQGVGFGAAERVCGVLKIVFN